jgi:hypothetical protein
MSKKNVLLPAFAALVVAATGSTGWGGGFGWDYVFFSEIFIPA